MNLYWFLDEDGIHWKTVEAQTEQQAWEALFEKYHSLLPEIMDETEVCKRYELKSTVNLG
jgi:hypothetical protein